MEGFGLAVIQGDRCASIRPETVYGSVPKGVLRLRFGQEETIPIVMGHQVRRVVQQETTSTLAPRAACSA